MKVNIARNFLTVDATRSPCILLLVLVAGCSVDQSIRLDSTRNKRLTSDDPRTAIGILRKPANTYRNVVLREAKAQLGKPYHWGGQTPATGFDCSGLVFFTHRKAGLKVPRISRSQWAASKRIAVQNIRPGDLVFFRIGSNVNHVGIYIGSDKFVHAPSRGGRVNIESLKSHYWRDRLVAAGNFYR